MPILQWVSGGWAMVPSKNDEKPDVNNLQQALAAYAHKAWSKWMKYLFAQCKVNEDGSVTIPADKVQRWTRQMNCDYSVLPASEQLSDMDEAYEILNIIDDWMA